MSVTVRVPPYWRRHTGRRADVSAEGATVGEALADVVRQHPELGPLLYGDDGELAAGLSVFLNRESITRRDGERTPVSPGDSLMVVLAIAGG
ncbi:MAG: MoaD/ThiS family protein [Armatimonadetes bacterium]|nr:MoaD/ThiS family protein [Armatimonadota bacterium]